MRPRIHVFSFLLRSYLRPSAGNSGFDCGWPRCVLCVSAGDDFSSQTASACRPQIAGSDVWRLTMLLHCGSRPSRCHMILTESAKAMISPRASCRLYFETFKPSRCITRSSECPVPPAVPKSRLDSDMESMESTLRVFARCRAQVDSKNLMSNRCPLCAMIVESPTNRENRSSASIGGGAFRTSMSVMPVYSEMNRDMR